ALGAGMAPREGMNAAGATAGRIYAECHALAAEREARSETFAGLTGAGDLVATVLAAHSRNRRAGELLAGGATVREIELELGQAAEALDLVPKLARAMKDSRIRAPETAALAGLIAQRSVVESVAGPG